ncbi:hypothetical protein ABTH36_19655, partial [Acinetobacter baumannii]
NLTKITDANPTGLGPGDKVRIEFSEPVNLTSTAIKTLFGPGAVVTPLAAFKAAAGLYAGNSTPAMPLSTFAASADYATSYEVTLGTGANAS